jgi:acetyl esterase/lipase
MNTEVIALSDDGSITLTAYLHESSAEMPIWQKRPAVLVLPGGGYTVTSDREADPVALSFLAQGFHAFILRYSVGPRATFPNPLCDVSRALQHVRKHADGWNVRADQIAVCGFSAGGHLAACLGTLWNDPEIMAAAGISEGENRPDALILCYPVISAINHAQANWFTVQIPDPARKDLYEKLSCELHVGPHTPPTFLFHTYQDSLVPVENSLLFAQALALADVPFEMHLFEHGLHGLSLANELSSNGTAYQNDASAERWFTLATTWLWRLFGKPGAVATEPDLRRAHFGDSAPTSASVNGERYAETGRFTLDTALGDLLDDPRARAVLERFLPAIVNIAFPDFVRAMALRTCLTYTRKTISETVLESLTQALATLA